MILEYIYSVMKKYQWDKLSDEQKFNLALYVTFDYFKTVIDKANPTNRQTFVSSIEEIDFTSAWTNVYFEYTFWLVIDFLNEKNNWFSKTLLTSFSEIGLRFVNYKYGKEQISEYIDKKEYRQCEILFRNKGIK